MILACPKQFTLAHIGMAAAVGHIIDIPIMIRSLASHVYRGIPGATKIFWDWEFVLALDAGDDQDDLAAVAASYHNEWWSGTSPAADEDYLCLENLEECLEHHRLVTGIKEILPRTLMETTSTWARHLAHSGPPGKELDCEKCQWYRGLAVTAWTKWQDMRHLGHALEVSVEGRRDNTKRRAAGVFQILEAVTLKEVQAEELKQGKGKGKGKESTAAMAERVRSAAAAELARLENAAEVKWTWGEGFSADEVLKVFEASKHAGRLHSGYVNSLPCGRQAPDSSIPNLEDGTHIGSSIATDTRTITTLPPHEYPLHFVHPPLRTYHGDPPAVGTPVHTPGTAAPVYQPVAANPGSASTNVDPAAAFASDDDKSGMHFHLMCQIAALTKCRRPHIIY
jgi:hypothetical protein